MNDFLLMHWISNLLVESWVGLFIKTNVTETLSSLEWTKVTYINSLLCRSLITKVALSFWGMTKTANENQLNVFDTAEM